MKASLKFREEKKPLLRAKVPLSIIGFPFQSGIVAGESKELSLNLSTFFDSGPTFKISYRPNDSSNPFSLVFKTGIGHFGSPISSSMTMSAEFNLIQNRNPSFFVHFKPQFGDFAIKKSQSSDFAKCLKPKSNGGVSDDDSSVEVIESSEKFFSGSRIRVLASESPASRVIGGLLSDVEVSARTVVPVRQRAVVKVRWGVRFPATESDAATNSTAGISFQRFPLLVMNKIGIEHVAEDEKVGPRLSSPENADVAAACFGVKRQLEVIQAENGMLRKAMDDLRSEIVAGNSSNSPAGCDRRGVNNKPSGDHRRNNGDKKSLSESKGFGGKGMEGDVNEELKKALMARENS